MPALPAMVSLAVVAGLLVWSARLLDEQECGNLGECLGNGLGALALGSVMAPVVVLVGMLVLRFPRRDLLVVPLLVLAPLLLWEPIEFVQTMNPVRAAGWLLWVLSEAAVVVAAWLLVRKAPTPVAVRILPLVLVLGLAFGLMAVEDAQARRRTVAEVGALPVTLRLVDLGSGFEITNVYASAGEYVSVDYSGKIDGIYSLPDVSLVPVDAGATACEAADVARPLGFDVEACSGDPFLTTRPGYTAVGLTRGDTVLVASFSPDSGLDAAWVREQLLAAPEVSADELVP